MTERKCTCSDYDKPQCDIRAKRNLCCIAFAKPSSAPPMIGFATEQEARNAGAVNVKVVWSRCSYWGTPRYVAA